MRNGVHIDCFLPLLKIEACPLHKAQAHRVELTLVASRLGIPNSHSSSLVGVAYVAGLQYRRLSPAERMRRKEHCG